MNVFERIIENQKAETKRAGMDEEFVAKLARMGIRIVDDVRLDLVEDLRQDMERYRELRPRPAAGLNQGGWKSGELFGRYPDHPPGWASPALEELREHIVSEIIPARLTRPGKIATGWAMINKDGSSHAGHTHSTARLVCVYYVASGDPPGPICFSRDGEVVTITPRPGQVVTFPGDLWHWVPEVKGSTSRISIAIDVGY